MEIKMISNLKFYCSSCKKYKPMVKHISKKDIWIFRNEVWLNILCRSCHFTMLTITTENHEIINNLENSKLYLEIINEK